MNRNWDIMRNAANGTSRMRDREQLPSREGEEGWGRAEMFGGAADYGYGAYGYEREPRWERRRRHVPSYGDEGFGLQSQGWADYGGGRERGWERGDEYRPRIDERRGEHPSLWERVKGAFTGKGPKNWTRSDERIREDVCEALTYHPHIDATDIEVSVKDGEVMLDGTVMDRRAKRLAEDIAEDVRGVRDVHNQLRMQRSQVQEDAPRTQARR